MLNNGVLLIMDGIYNGCNVNMLLVVMFYNGYDNVENIRMVVKIVNCVKKVKGVQDSQVIVIDMRVVIVVRINYLFIKNDDKYVKYAVKKFVDGCII